MSERGTDKPKMRMNPQERMFYEQLPESMRAHSPGLTLSYRQRLGMLHGYLRVLYGERADWGRCVAGYEGQVSACGASGAREVACCKDVPEIGEADLEKWLSAEADDVALASEIADAFKKLQACEETLRCSGGPSNSPSKEEKRRQCARLQLRCAELLGVTPQLSGRVYYEHLIERRGMTSAEVDAFFRRLYANDDEGDWAVAGGNFGMLVQELAKRFTDGLVANFGGTTAVMQAPGRYYYRGENAFYGSSRPGLFRGRKARMAPLDVFVSLLRMDEAGWFLDNFDAVREWPIANGTVRYEALMQHYGLPTWVLDATNDLITALFFACCKFEDGAWRPLCDGEVRDVGSRKHVCGMGGDSRFGMLYRNKAEVETMRFFLGVNGEYAEGWNTGWHRAIPGNDDFYDEVVPIGYQPFMRCSAQHGYVMWASDESYDMYKDPRFEKFKIRLTGDLCRRVFELADGGARAFPNGDIPRIDDYLREIGKTTTFTEEAFRSRCIGLGLDVDVMLAELRKAGYQVRRNPKRITDKKVRTINSRFGIVEALERVGVRPMPYPMVVIG